MTKKDKKFIWLKVLYIVKDMENTDNLATRNKTIDKLYKTFTISEKNK